MLLLAILTLLASSIGCATINRCGTGCMRCSPEGACLFCDPRQSLVLSSSGGCAASRRPNCRTLGVSGDCLVCSAGFRPDPSGSGGCVVVAEPLANCVIQTGLASCARCARGYRPGGAESAEACTAVSQQVPRCEVYGTAGECAICEKGYVPTGSGGACVEMIQGCLVASPVECKACASGFVLGHASAMTALVAGSRTARSLIMALVQAEITAVGSVGDCEKVEARNCLTVAGTRACASCPVGYFLAASGDCEAAPESPVQFCAEYFAPGACLRCERGYYLQKGECHSAALDGCAELDGRAATPVCARCEAQRYASDGACIVRRNLFARCRRYATAADACEVCESGLLLTPDGGGCLSIPVHCEETSFTAGTGGGYQASCVRCSRGFRLRPGQASSINQACATGSVLGCGIYEPNDSEEVCAECENGWFLEAGGVCSRQPSIPGCSEFGGAGECVACEAGYRLFALGGSCRPASLVAGCRVYVSPGECGECEEGYFLSALSSGGVAAPGSACFSILQPGCLRSDDGRVCLLCEPGLDLIDDGCVGASTSAIENCDNLRSGADGQQPTQCEGCKVGTAPFDSTEFTCSNATAVASSLWLSLPPVPGCMAYVPGEGCAMCQPGLFVQDGVRCVSSCPNGVSVARFVSIGGSLQLRSRNYCVSDSIVPNCAEYAPLLSSPLTLGCSRCLDGSLPLLAAAGSATPGGSLRLDFGGGGALTPIGSAPGLAGCVTAAGVANCALFQTDGSTVVCVRCALGFGGTSSAFTAVLTPPATKINTCSAVTNCLAGVELPGLPQSIARIFSCHACVAGFPYAAVVETAGVWIARIGSTLSCSVPTDTIPDCLLYVRVLPQHAAAENSVSPRCAACRGGTAPTISGGCARIANCEGGEWPSACSVCATNFAYPFRDGKVVYTECVAAYSVPRCLSIDSTGRCVVCQTGYSRNADGRCETLPRPRCLNSDAAAPPMLPTTAAMTALFVSLAGSGLGGCATCQSGYVSVLLSDTKCLESAYAYGSLPSDSVFVPRCLRLRPASPKPLCVECVAGFVLRDDGRQCASPGSSARLANCRRFALATGECLECFPGFARVAGGCRAANIANCASFVANAAVLRCEACSEGFALAEDGSSCLAGEVLGCAEFVAGAPTKCKRCLPGRARLVRNDGSTLCLPLPSWTNCTRLDETRLAEGTMECAKCPAGLAPAPAVFPAGCMRLDSVLGCRTRSTTPLLSPGSLECAECEEGRFLVDGACVAVTPVSNCKVYKPDRDACAECRSGFLLLGGVCSPYPAGIAGCADYASPTSCARCQAGLFLSGGQCLAAEIIPNCARFASASICSACDKGYYLSNGRCQSGSIENCALFSASGGCIGCQPRFRLSSNSCLAFSDLRCLEMKDTLCVRCEAGYAPSGGECAVPSLFIPNCLYYGSSPLCLQCFPGFMLSLDLKSCVSPSGPLIDANCIDARQRDPPVCVLCGPGLYLADGVCKNCPDQGCFACTPRLPSECVLCRSGFVMSVKGACSPQPGYSLPSSSDTPTTPTTPTNDSKTKTLIFSTSILTFFALIFFQ